MNIPVFDIGDTLLPSRRMINRKVHEHTGTEKHFPIEEYNIYVPEEVQNWLDENGLEGNAEEITRSYLDWERSFFRGNSVVETLKKCNQELGTIGFISDNSIAAKKFYRELFQELGVEYRGFVVSEEVGVKKPSREIFEAFLDKRERPAEKFAYFGNNPERDSGAEKVGMDFVWVDRYDDFGSEWSGKTIQEFSFEKIQEAV
ncbi:MAG: HAD family hydrolase [Candidatus Nanohaloarchaea archaeon]